MSVKVIDRSPQISARMRVNGSIAIKRALDDVKRLSRPKTPYSGGKTGYVGGHLKDSVLTQVLGFRGRIVWDKAYAAYQERGKRKDGSHRVRHYTTSGTGAHFAEDVIKDVDKRRKMYLRGIVR